MTTNKKLEWLRVLAILVFVAVISPAQLLVHKDVPGEKFILIAISLVTYATIPIVFKFWPIPGEKEISAKRWGAFFVILAAGLIVINFHLARPWLNRHQRVDEIVSNLSLALGGWLIPGFVASIAIIVFLFKRLHPRQ